MSHQPQAIALFGECMLELRAQQEATGLWRQSFAGDTCNTAIYLARLLKNAARSLGEADVCANANASVKWAMGLGQDRFAQSMSTYWRAEGLDDSLCREIESGSSGLYAIHVDTQGERHFSYWRDTSAARCYFDSPQTPLEMALPKLQGLHFSGISLAILNEAGRERLLDCARRLRAQGGWVSFDTNYRPALWGSQALAREVIMRAMGLADYVLVSMDEWLLLSGMCPQQPANEQLAMEQLRQKKYPELLVKRGGQSTWLSVAGAETQIVPVSSHIKPVDTTAAGDAFAAAYLAARLHQLPPEQAALCGNRLAGIVTEHPGAIIEPHWIPDDLLQMNVLA